MKIYRFKQVKQYEIIILERSSQPSESNPYPLQGKVIHYDEPIESVP
ncbi:hypothetical protein [Nostoc sp.]